MAAPRPPMLKSRWRAGAPDLQRTPGNAHSGRRHPAAAAVLGGAGGLRPSRRAGLSAGCGPAAGLGAEPRRPVPLLLTLRIAGPDFPMADMPWFAYRNGEIGIASCRERVCQYV